MFVVLSSRLRAKTDKQGLAGFNPFAGMQGMDNLNDPNAVSGADELG
jgi:hypothetical protein